MNEIPSRYNSKETEDKWYKFWEEKNLFTAKPNPAQKPFCIVIPPPNVTGILHMGHALNNSIQDILIRYQRMKGLEALWMPGTDHAGIATQNVVEKAIAKEGLKRQDLGREKFLERIWQWREEYGSTIIEQLKKMGASCDWARTRFTMDEEYSKAVVEVFVRLYEKGLLYQGNYIINWCPRCQTALSDEEAPHRELQGNLYYIKYPFKEVNGLTGERVSGLTRTPAHPHTRTPVSDCITVATTRPETMLGDTAVAVNPKDKRYKSIIGRTLILPLVNREIKIIADSMIDMEFGTGAVKVTPAHDPDDYSLGIKHKLEFVNVIYPNGQMNENAGEYKDMDRFKAREVILEDLKKRGLLEKVESHQLSAGHCYRCHTIIEPYLSKQWFVKMKPLAEPAIEAVKKGEIKFYPKRWTKVYLNWMENIQDWCISRQIWWGHRIPVYYCRKCQETGIQKSKINPSTALRVDGERSRTIKNQKSKIEEGVIVARTKPEKCPKCGSNDIYQDEDVLDTWFSSWLWPFAAFYWPMKGLSPKGTVPDEDLKYFYPTSVLVTAPEIIFFWVARMIMAGLEFMKDIPFKDVYIHGTVRDIEGKKMSKSLGNIIDPLEIINEYGADALRFSLVSITSQGQDVFLSKERFEQGRNFANKIWNASRFILMNLDFNYIKTDLCVFFKKENLNIVNRWILSRFYTVLKETSKALDNYKFNEAENLLYHFFWHEFCDWYLEMIKSEIKHGHNQVVMYKVLEKSLRILHPFMPFITEEIWQRLKESTSIMIEPWPHIQEEIIDKKTEKKVSTIFEIITAIRNTRQELGIPVQKETTAIFSSTSKSNRELIESLSLEIKKLAQISLLKIEAEDTAYKSSISILIKDIRIAIPLEGIIELEKEKTKIKERSEKMKADIRHKENLLSNEGFANKAPEEVVAKEKNKVRELKDTLSKLKNILNEIR